MSYEQKVERLEKSYRFAISLADRVHEDRRFKRQALDLIDACADQIRFDDEMLRTQGKRKSELKLPALVSLSARWGVEL